METVAVIKLTSPTHLPLHDMRLPSHSPQGGRGLSGTLTANMTVTIFLSCIQPAQKNYMLFYYKLTQHTYQMPGCRSLPFFFVSALVLACAQMLCELDLVWSCIFMYASYTMSS